MLDQLAHDPDPYPHYAELRERGVHQVDDGRWVVARAADVLVIMSSPAVVVGFGAPPDGPATALRGRMARFSDGADHARRRSVAVERLAAIAPGRLREWAFDLTDRQLDDRAELDVMVDIARRIPAAALALELGAKDVAAAVAAASELAVALAPPAGSPAGDPTGPAQRLAQLLRLGDPPTLDDTAVNVVALLFQAFDATAGLVGNAVIALDRFGTDSDVGRLVAETNRFDPPVQLTNRVATEPIQLGGTTIPAGDRIVVLLAAANRDPEHVDHPDRFDPERKPEAFTFGVGRRPCPGSEHASALAAGILAALRQRRATLVEDDVTYEPRPNLRIPARLEVSLAA